MPAIPVEEVIVHLHGTGAEYTVISAGDRRPTGGGIATLNIIRRADGHVSVAITFMFRVFDFRVPQREWDAALEEMRRAEFFAGYDEGFNSTGEGHNAECQPPGSTQAQHERARRLAWQERLAEITK